MKSWPALEIHNVSDPELLLAVLDDYQPTAIDEQGAMCVAYFSTTNARDAAHAALGQQFAVRDVDVPDDDWARRSQENLTPITVGRVVVTPPWHLEHPTLEQSLAVVIAPSMGFGTGHHATTRLCLRALQTIELSGRFVLDVGTGSGVLAIGARRLGAREAVGIDSDPDAIHAATENLEWNSGVDSVRFMVGDLRTLPLPGADVVTANLSGALLCQNARTLLSVVRPGGTLIVSGLQQEERGDVLDAFAGAAPAWEEAEDGWVGLAFNVPHRSPV